MADSVSLSRAPKLQDPLTHAPDPKRTARSMFGSIAAKDPSNFTLEEAIDRSPRVANIRTRIERTKKKMMKSTEKVEAYSQLGKFVDSFAEKMQLLRRPMLDADNIFKHKAAIVISTEDREGFLSVSVKPGALNSDFNIAIHQIATHHSMLLGTEDTSQADLVVQDVEAGVDLAAIIDTITNNVAIEKDASGRVANPCAYALYEVLQDSLADSIDIDIVKERIREMHASMVATGISRGFARLDSPAVGPSGTPGVALDAGNYTLLAMPGAKTFPDLLRAFLYQTEMALYEVEALDELTTKDEALGEINGTLNGGPANSLTQSVIDAISGLPGGDISRDDVLNAAREAAKANMGVKLREYYNGLSAGDYHANPWALELLSAMEKSVAAGDDFDAMLENVNVSAYEEYHNHCLLKLNEGDTLQNVIDKINRTTEHSGVQAQAINIGGSYVLKISSAKTGTGYRVSVLSDDVNMNVDKLNKFTGGLSRKNNDPVNAQYTLDGDFVISNLNTVSITPYVTFALLKPNSAGHSEHVRIAEDKVAAMDSVIELVDAFNTLSAFVARQTERDPKNDYAFRETAILGNSALLAQLQTLLSTIMTRFVSAPNGAFKSLQEIGITLKNEHADPENGVAEYQKLVIDEELLRQAIDLDYSKVRDLLSFSYNATDSSLSVVGHVGSYEGLGRLRISVHPDVDFDDNPGKRAKIEFMAADNNTVLKTEYYALSGQVGSYLIDCKDSSSMLYGLTLSYFSNEDKDDIMLDIYQGVADRAYGAIYHYLDDKNSAKSGLVSAYLNSEVSTDVELTKDLQESEAKLAYTEDVVARNYGAKLAAAHQAQLNLKFLEMSFEAQYGK